MMKAELEDLYKEWWLRKRNSGELKWVTKTGKEIPVKDMTDEHLENAINCVENLREMNDIAAEYAAYMNSRMG